MKNLRLSALLTVAAFCTLQFTQKVSAQIQTPRYSAINSNTLGYYEYLPQGYSQSGSESYPLIVFIHGLGELGLGNASQLPRVLNNGIPKLINQNKFPTSFNSGGKAFKFIVISPQFKAWPKAVDVDAVVEMAKSKYKVDAKRIYITGLSMGGGATWDYVTNPSTDAYAKKTAAIVPVCGAAHPTTTKTKIIVANHLPVWALHNQGDPTVTVTNTNNFVAYINNSVPAPSPAARKTIWNVGGHDAWSKAYDPNYRENGMNIYEWMLQYQRNGSAANAAPTANAGANISIKLPVNETRLSGSATDSDGSIAKYAWTKVSGPSSFAFSSTSSATPIVSRLTEGTYVFRLTVTDNSGATASDDVSVVVTASVVAPPPPPPTTVTKEVNVNVFGGSNGATDSKWNNWNIGNGKKGAVTSANLKYSDGSASTIKAKLSSSENIGDNGVLSAFLMAPAQVMRHTSFASGTRTLTISGLSSSKRYDITLYASRIFNVNNFTIFSNGSLKDTLSTFRNYSSNVNFKGLVPNANGELVINIGKIGQYNYFNGFILKDGSSEKSSSVSTQTVSARMAQETEEPSTTLKLSQASTSDRFMLNINNNIGGLFKVNIVDKSGETKKSFSFVKNEGQLQTYLSLKELPAGDYKVEVNFGDWKQQTTITKL